jgi:hypothetical protein
MNTPFFEAFFLGAAIDSVEEGASMTLLESARTQWSKKAYYALRTKHCVTRCKTYTRQKKRGCVLEHITPFSIV